MTQYLVGIDLGTTHSVLAYTRAEDGGAAAVEVLSIPQLVAAGEIGERPLLPSVVYLYQAGEFDPADVGLPWPAADGAGQGMIVGEWARELGEKTPGRLVASAKSWLSHDRVDRNAPILPWGNDGGASRISPVEASARVLGHLRAAWNHRFADAPLEHQSVVITVPASFDEGARALTLDAAARAGLGEIRLLEEPQAACYDWLAGHAELPAASRVLLICDVGGGTTDLTLIAIDRDGPDPRLERIGVGSHLMLGGDNIDLALAHQAEQAGEQRLNYARLAQLLQQTRLAKEALLRADAPESRQLVLFGGGSKLLAGSRTVEIGRQQVRDLVLQGYFPLVDLEAIARSPRSAVVDFGLPYASEAAVTRHLADFILRHQQAIADALDVTPHPGQALLPDSLLLNGGVFNAGLIRERLVAQLEAWRGAPVTELTGIDPHLAVARGAVCYELARRGRGRRIGGGSARSYYLRLDTGARGADDGGQLVCLLPKGAPVGRPLALAEREFALALGGPVRFDLLTSTADTRVAAGELLAEDAIETPLALPPLATVLTADQGPAPNGSAREARVRLQAELTEIGTLSVSCIDCDSGRPWMLEFQLRDGTASTVDCAADSGAPASSQPPAAARPAGLDQALGLIDQLYGKAVSKPDPKLIKRVRGDLEKLLGPRPDWDTATIRELFDRMLAGRAQRRRSVAHEQLWLNLAGFCLRPGYGAELDDWRVEQVQKLYQQGVIHQDEARVWAEWWTLWRRIAGALDESLQQRIFRDIGYYLHPSVAHSRQRKAELQRRAYNEMVRLLGSLEGLSAEQKKEAGEWLLARLEKGSEPEQTWWAIGRLGARVPFHGNAHKTLDAATARAWLEPLLAKNWQKEKTPAFAATLIARHSGDRELDLGDDAKRRVIEKLQASRCPPSWLQTVSERVELDQADARRVFGEALPQGLRLL